MSHREIASLSFKLAGIYVLVESVGYVSNAVYYFQHSLHGDAAVVDHRSSRVLAVTWASLGAALMLGALILILGGRRLARRTFPGENTTPSPQILGLHAFTYSVVAVILVAYAVPQLVSALVSTALSARGMSGFMALARYDLIQPAVFLVMGLALFFGSHGLVRLWSRLRYSGLRRKMGFCIRCGYDLTGNTTGICPECGTRQVAKPDPDTDSTARHDTTISP